MVRLHIFIDFIGAILSVARLTNSLAKYLHLELFYTHFSLFVLGLKKLSVKDTTTEKSDMVHFKKAFFFHKV